MKARDLVFAIIGVILVLGIGWGMLLHGVTENRAYLNLLTYSFGALCTEAVIYGIVILFDYYLKEK